MQEITQALGTSLRKWRRINKKSQSWVARQCMTSQNQVSMFERGREIGEVATFSLSKFVQNTCLNEQRSDALNEQREPVVEQDIPEAVIVESRYEKIIEWLYCNDEGYASKNDWRKAFIIFLKEIL